MKTLKNILYEGLLSGEDNVLNQGDELTDKMHLFHWKFSKSYRYKVYKNVVGGLGSVFKKHFIKKPVILYTHWTADPISKRPNDEPRFSHDKYSIDYLYAIILNTKFPKPIESYNLYNFKDVHEITNAIEEQLRFYMNDDSRTFRTKERNFPVLTADVFSSLGKLKIAIYYHQDDIKYESQLLCDLEFNKTEN